jgi:hypothetical protein
MNHRRAAVAALAVAGLLALGACGATDSPRQEAQAQPERGAAEANQRMLDAHRRFQQAIEDAAANQRALDAHRTFQQALVEVAAEDHVAYVPASPDQIERRAVQAAEARVQYRPVSADQIERRAVQAAADSSAPWWTHKR